MHPLLLFTLLFVPGIKCSEGVLQDIHNFKRNGGEGYPFFGAEVTPIEEPKTVDVVNPGKNDEIQLKAYQSHIAKNNDNYGRLGHNADLKNHHKLLSFKVNGNQEDQGQLNKRHDYIGKLVFSKNKEKHFGNKGFYKHLKHSQKPNTLNYGKYQFSKSILDDIAFDDAEKFVKHDSNVDKVIRKEQPARVDDYSSAEFIYRNDDALRKKPSGEFSWNNFKNDKEKNTFERIKRQTDSSDSEDEDYNGDDEDDSDDFDGFSSVEKRILPQMMAGTDDNTHPYEDTIEIKLKEKEGEMVPVIEDKITKTTAYVSCRRGGGAACGEDQYIGAQHEYDVHAAIGEGNKKQEEESEDYHIDMEAWLKAFEREIINHGVNVKYNHE